MDNINKSGFLIFIIFNLILNVKSQCDDKLIQKSQLFFDAGKFDSVIVNLSPCVTPVKVGFGFSQVCDCKTNDSSLFVNKVGKSSNNPEKIRALRLLSLSYLFSGVDSLKEKAISMAKLVFCINPLDLLERQQDDIFDSYDSREFQLLYKEINEAPIYYWSIKGGLTLGHSYSLRDYGIDFSEQDRQIKLGHNFSFGSTLEFPIKPGFLSTKSDILTIGSGIYWTRRAFGYRHLLNLESDSLLFSKLNFIEVQNWLDIPIYLRYQTPHSKRFGWAIAVGADLNILLNANLKNISRTTRLESTTNSSQLNITNERITISKLLKGSDDPNARGTNLFFNHRKKINGSLTFSGEGKYRFNNFQFFTLGFKYNFFLLNIINRKHRYSNKELIYSYGYIDDDRQLHGLVFYAGLRIAKFCP